MNSMRLHALFLAVFFLLAILHLGNGQGIAPSPPPPMSDGKAIDQGIAYILLLLALAITYLIH